VPALHQPEAASARSLTDQAYYRIRELIVRLELAPGSFVNERDLMELVGLGRTPVREALRTLARDRLVEVLPRRGIFISPINVREWFQSLMQPDNPYMSCCGEADAFEADTFEVDGDHYVAVITDGKGVLPSGTRINVPNQKMKWDRGNPTGHGIIFIGNQGQVYCYVAPGGV